MSGPGEGGGLVRAVAERLGCLNAEGFEDGSDCVCDAWYDAQTAAAAVHAWLTSALLAPEVVEAVKWRLDHYGPLDAEPFQYSRFESPAHAAIDGVIAALSALPVGEGER